jgi:hypothetical protein
MSLLKNHPFAVEAFFKSSVVVTFAFPKEQLQALIPPCLSLDTFEDKWAFLAVAMVDTTHLRPKGFPRFLGNNFFLAGYRIFVRYKNLHGKNLRGLYILKSQTDKFKMQLLGNVFTYYNYEKVDILRTELDGTHNYKSVEGGFSLSFRNNSEKINLPEGSPFPDWKTARRFAGPLPFTFSFDALKKQVLIIEGVRTNWTPKPIEVVSYNFDFLNKEPYKSGVLANAFEINNIPYYWKKGKIEKWQKNEDLLMEF